MSQVSAIGNQSDKVYGWMKPKNGQAKGFYEHNKHYLDFKAEQDAKAAEEAEAKAAAEAAAAEAEAAAQQQAPAEDGNTTTGNTQQAESTTAITAQKLDLVA